MDFSAILGDFDPTVPPPQIAAVPEGVHRPRWSVMIPTYNCAQYLRQTLESILAQSPGPEEMQIEVIDDCSTKDDPEAVVYEVGKGRVSFYRKPQNEGAIPNFNTCIERSRGELVHILHGDDYVLPGFYGQIGDLVRQNQACGLFATRCFFVDESNVISCVSPRLPDLEGGGTDCRQFVDGTALQFAGVVLRREFLEKHGGFRPSLVHCADWEMWVRAITKGKGVVSSDVLAGYRVFKGNDTSRLMRTGENLRDILRLHLTLAHESADYPFDQVLVGRLVERATSQAMGLQAQGESTAAQAAAGIAESLRSHLPKPQRDLSWFLYGVSNRLRCVADSFHKS